MCSVPIGMIVGRTHVLDYPVNLGLSYVTLIAAEAGRQGGDSIIYRDRPKSGL